jgi:hypothetical protein
MVDPDAGIASAYMLSLETAAAALKVVLINAPVHSDAEIETAIILTFGAAATVALQRKGSKMPKPVVFPLGRSSRSTMSGGLGLE